MDEMDRNTFFKVIWKKGIKPLILISGLIFIVLFVVNVFQENGKERFIVLFVLAIGVFFLLANLIGLLTLNVMSYVYSKLPMKLKAFLTIFGKVMDYLSPIIFGMIVYHMWIKDWIFTSLFFGFTIFGHVVQIIQKERIARSSSKSHSFNNPE